jgi:ABC-type protease/lipase transport system fused ATPase/permease subunit
VKLSGGQKQRLALARAILVLILDEATSSVDAEAAYLIQQALDEVLKGRTALVIAHRLSTIRNADKIIALEGGRIREVGDHALLWRVVQPTVPPPDRTGSSGPGRGRGGMKTPAFLTGFSTSISLFFIIGKNY